MLCKLLLHNGFYYKPIINNAGIISASFKPIKRQQPSNDILWVSMYELVSDPYILQGCCCFFLETCNIKSKDSMAIFIIYCLSIALQRLYLPYYIVFILVKSLNICENFVVYTNHYSLKGSHSENILVGVFLSSFKSLTHIY